MSIRFYIYSAGTDETLDGTVSPYVNYNRKQPTLDVAGMIFLFYHTCRTNTHIILFISSIIKILLS